MIVKHLVAQNQMSEQSKFPSLGKKAEQYHASSNSATAKKSKTFQRQTSHNISYPFLHFDSLPLHLYQIAHNDSSPIFI